MRPLSIFALSLVALVMSGSAANAQNWQNVDKINKWFEDHKDKRYEMQEGGEVGKAKDIGTAGELRKLDKEMPVPKGEKAIRTVADQNKCKHRIVVHAETLFEFDQSTLTRDAEGTLRLIGPKIEKLGLHPVAIEGHTDSVGNEEYNRGLSLRRAERVKNWLLTNHFVRKDTEIKGFGETKPVAPNTTKEGKDNPLGRQLNRRVEIVVDTCTTLEPEQNTKPLEPAADATAPNTSATETPTEKQPAVGGATTDPAARNAALLPVNNLYLPDEIGKSFTAARVTPLGDPELYFELLMPNDWQSRPITVTRKQLREDTENQVPLAELAPPDKSNVVTEVRYMRVGADVTPEQFLLAYAQKSGFEIVTRQHAQFNGRSAEDALLKLTGKDSVEMLTRLTVSKRGQYMFLIASSAPAAEYDNWKKIFGAEAISFDPRGKSQ